MKLSVPTVAAVTGAWIAMVACAGGGHDGPPSSDPPSPEPPPPDRGGRTIPTAPHPPIGFGIARLVRPRQRASTIGCAATPLTTRVDTSD